MNLLLCILSVFPKVDSGILGEDVAWVVLMHGETVAEHYPEEFPSDYLHHVHSVTKSVTSLLVGIAIELDLIPAVDAPLNELFPRYDYLIDDDLKRSIRMRDILSMTSGLNWRGGIGGVDLLEMIDSDDWTSYVLERPMADEPGISFVYNSGGTHLLSVLIQRSYGGTTGEFAREYLFTPLGIENWVWTFLSSPDGVTPGAWGLNMTVADMAKLGELILRRGYWGSSKVVSEEWILESTSVQISRPESQSDYGYQWWLPRDFGIKTICARGWYGGHSAFIYAFPTIDMVLATAGGFPDEDGVEDIIGIAWNSLH